MYDEKRRLIKVGDIIKFFKEPELLESFDVKAMELLVYNSYDEMFNDFSIKELADVIMSRQELMEAL